tara:strand:+ start:1002 stop:1466 length:465 start_codon:yes stop_codon:yes gene_type:complete
MQTNIKKKTLIFSILLVISIQILLVLNNRQKTTFRYFIWNIQEVSIGKLICISFVTGLFISSLLNKSLNININHKEIIEEEVNTINENDFLDNIENNNESYEITPERDLRDPQPTISVNYRVIKNNGETELKDRNQPFDMSQYEDDWNNNFPEW